MCLMLSVLSTSSWVCQWLPNGGKHWTSWKWPNWQLSQGVGITVLSLLQLWERMIQNRHSSFWMNWHWRGMNLGTMYWFRFFKSVKEQVAMLSWRGIWAVSGIITGSSHLLQPKKLSFTLQGGYCFVFLNQDFGLDITEISNANYHPSTCFMPLEKVKNKKSV